MKVREYTAAGGIVQDDQGRVLLITRTVQRNGGPSFEVRLPKGHVEEGETEVEAAMREVCEETGYCGLAVVADLGTTVTQFDLKDEHVRRTEHYYLMRLTAAEPGQPHFDSPGADEAKFENQWVRDLAAAESALTFPSEKLFAGRARELKKNP